MTTGGNGTSRESVVALLEQLEAILLKRGRAGDVRATVGVKSSQCVSLSHSLSVRVEKLSESSKMC